MNDFWAAVLTEGRITLHPIVREPGDDDDEIRIPGPAAPADVTCFTVTQHFLIIGTQRGLINYFLCDDQACSRSLWLFRQTRAPVAQHAVLA